MNMNFNINLRQPQVKSFNFSCYLCCRFWLEGATKNILVICLSAVDNLCLVLCESCTGITSHVGTSSGASLQQLTKLEIIRKYSWSFTNMVEAWSHHGHLKPFLEFFKPQDILHLRMLQRIVKLTNSAQKLNLQLDMAIGKNYWFDWELLKVAVHNFN